MTNQESENPQNTNHIADLAFHGVAQIIAGIISPLFGLNPLASRALALFIHKHLGLILTIIICPPLIVSLMIFSSFQKPQVSQNLGAEATSLDGIEAVVLAVPYFNQWLEPDGSRSPAYPKIPVRGQAWDLGNVICGAASSTMIAGYFGKLPYDRSNENDLKRFAYRDEGLGLPSKCANQSIRGAFGMTAYNSTCNMSSYEGMAAYLQRMGLHPINRGGISFEKVKAAIDRGNPMIVSMTAPYGHIAVIKGYTKDGRVVMNDPFRNVQAPGRGYSYNGKNALYHVYTDWTVNYILEVSA